MVRSREFYIYGDIHLLISIYNIEKNIIIGLGFLVISLNNLDFKLFKTHFKVMPNIYWVDGLKFNIQKVLNDI